MSRDPALGQAPSRNMQNHSQTITLVGAGLTGPLLGISLAQRGFRVQIFERRPDMRLVRSSAGRSINLAVSTRGIHALREAGLWDQMSRIIIPMKGRMMHSLTGELTFQPYGQNDAEVINSISRADLNVALMDAAEAQGVAIHFGERCIGMDWKTAARVSATRIWPRNNGRFRRRDRHGRLGLVLRLGYAETGPPEVLAGPARLRLQGVDDRGGPGRASPFSSRTRCTSGRAAPTC